jgi:hypothetical protein
VARKRKKKGVNLPKLTVLAYDQRSLLLFCEAVEKLKAEVLDLQTLKAELKDAVAAAKIKMPRGTKGKPVATDLPLSPLPPIPAPERTGEELRDVPYPPLFDLGTLPQLI